MQLTQLHKRSRRIERTFGLTAKYIPKWHGLYYWFGGDEANGDLHPAPLLGIEINSGREFFLGIRCLREDSQGVAAVEGAYDAIQKAVSESRLVEDFRQDDNHLWWPCWRYVRPDSPSLTFEHVAKLGFPAAQERLAGEIADNLRGLWDALEDDTRHLF